MFVNVNIAHSIAKIALFLSVKTTLYEDFMDKTAKGRENLYRPFGIKDKIGYLMGDFGNDFTFVLSSSFLLKFYTDVMGVNAAIVGVVMMLARFVDAFTDVAMGRICDKAKKRRSGKFKPWILRMCAPVAIASFLIYQSSLASMPLGFKVGWLTVTYILWGSIFYTSINIPYGSMASAISQEPADRQSLSTWRSMGASLAGLVIGAGIPLIVYEKAVKDGATVTVMIGERFTLVAGALSLFSIVAYLLCYYLTTERVLPNENREEHRSVKELIKNSVKNRSIISVIAASIVMLLSQLTLQGMANYIYPNYYNNSGAMAASTVAMVISMFIAAAVAKPLSEKIGKAEISAASSAVAAFICLLLFFLRPLSVWTYVAFNFLSWLGLGIYSMVSWALITDVIDDAEIKNGVREDGSIYALYSFARKLGQAAAAGLTGALLTAIGYSEATAFDRGVLDGIYNIATLLPALGFGLLALILWFWYPLHKDRVTENVEILKKKRL